MAEKKKLSLPMKILIAMVAGTLLGLLFLEKGLFFNAATQTAHAFFNPGTITTWIRPFGTLFLQLIQFIVVPVVLCSLITGVVNLKDINKLGSIGGKILVFYLCTTIFALAIGFSLALLFKGFYPVIPNLAEYTYEAASVDITTTLLGLFPNNIIVPFNAPPQMLPIIFISIAVGLGILTAREKGVLVGNFFEAANEVFMNIMMFIVNLAPYGVFALMSWVVANHGPGLFIGLGTVLLAAYLAYILHMAIVYSIAVSSLGGMSPLKFFKGMGPAMAVAFSSASSLASLAINIDCAKKLGCREHVVNFGLPLGANINSDGTAIYQGIASVFIAACYGIDLTIGQMLMITLTATLASFGIAGVPGAGMIMLAMVLGSVGLPIEGIAIIAGIDRLFDMGRTTLNVVGDVVGVIVVDNMEMKKEAKQAKA